MNYRHFLFLAIALIISLSVRAQFILTPTGLTTEDEKGYYVLLVLLHVLYLTRSCD